MQDSDDKMISKRASAGLSATYVDDMLIAASSKLIKDILNTDPTRKGA